jgi:8-oxo-dGTP pyrophosphatase MutT (NUDIX family)
MDKDTRVFISSNNISQSAGGILANEDDKKICLIKNENTNEWLLPKGRIEDNENIKKTVKREVYEESGYLCDVNNFVGLQIRPMKDKKTYKIIHWYLCFLKDNTKHINTQESYENFTTKWFSYNESINILTFDDDKNIIKESLKYLK